MRFHFSGVVACLALMTLASAVGCGAKDAGSTPAAIDSSDTNPAGSAAEESAQQPGADLHPVVVIETSLGEISVRLDAEKAPLTVVNFLAYVDNRHYEQTIFHQVLKDDPQVVIGGAFTPQLTEKPTHTTVRNEAHNGLSNRRGTIAMARRPDAIDSATCHFFFNVSDNHEVLDHKDRTRDGYGYCVFGEVTAGLNVVEKIAAVEVNDQSQFERIPVKTVLIRSVRRAR